MQDVAALRSVLKLGASSHDHTKSSVTTPRSKPRAILVVHGMGQQLRFETLDAAANGLHREDVRRYGQEDARPAVPGSVVLDDQRLERIELQLRTKGPDQEVHIYEAYWSVLSEGHVTLRDVIGFMISAGINGAKQACGTFQQRVFSQITSRRAPLRTLLYLFIALLTVLSLIIINAAIIAVSAVRAPLSTPPGWLSDAVFRDLTHVFNAAVIVVEAFVVAMLGSIWLSRIRGSLSSAAGLQFRRRLALVLAVVSTVLLVASLLAIIATAAAIPTLLLLHAAVPSQDVLTPMWARTVGAATPYVTIGLGLLIGGVAGLGYFVRPIFDGYIRQWGEESLTSVLHTTTVLVVFVGIVSGAVYFALAVLDAAVDPLGWQAIALATPVWLTLVVVGGIVRGFLIQYVGDLAAYLESHKVDRFHKLRSEIRTSVLKTGQAIYGARTRNGDFIYSEVVIVGHSLGSVIAYDTLNRLLLEDSPASGRNVHRNVIGRTPLLLTFGSPLDKTAFIFNTQSKKGSMTYVREALAATLQPLIDRREVRCRIRWLNLHSPWDIISGRLDYYDDPGSTVDAVENVLDREALTLLGAHTEYWRDWLLFERLYAAVNPDPDASGDSNGAQSGDCFQANRREIAKV